MPFPPILQQQHILPSRVQLKQAGARGAPQPPLSDGKRTSTDKEELSNSWPSATLKRQLERRNMASMGTQHQQQDAMLHPARRFIQQVPKGITRSYESVMHPHTATLNRTRRGLAGDLRRSSKVQQEMLGQQHTPLQQHQPPTPQKPRHQQQVITASPQPLDVHFSLCLTPEAILVIQKRNLEKQLLQQQRNTNTKRIFASSRGWGPRDRGDVSHRLPPQKTAPPDVRELVKISLLNDQHRYDDVEYEEDEIWMMRDGGQGYILDEALVRRCTEWLQGVEMATTRDRTLTDKLQTLPHLNTY